MAWWAHVLWQRHNLPIEEFLDWPWQKRLVYIASESIELENPVRLDTIRIK